MPAFLDWVAGTERAKSGAIIEVESSTHVYLADYVEEDELDTWLDANAVSIFEDQLTS